MEESKRKKKRPLLIIGISIGALLLTYFGGGIVASFVVAHSIFDHRGSDASKLNHTIYSLYNTRKNYDVLANREVYTFPSKNNDTLTSYFYSSSSPKGTVISIHGMGSFSDGLDAQYQQWFVSNGYNLLALDLTASGESEGNSMKGLHQSAYDAYSAYSYLLDNNKIVSPLIMVGHSWGAFGAAASLSLGVKADYVISFSGYDTPMEEMYCLAKNYVGALAPITYPAFILGMNMRFGGDANISASSAIKNSSAKALLIQGDNDKTVPYDKSLYKAAEKLDNVTLLSLTNVGHERPWQSKEALDYALDYVAKLGSKFKDMSGEEADKALSELGYDKDEASKLSSEVFDAISKFLSN